MTGIKKAQTIFAALTQTRVKNGSTYYKIESWKTLFSDSTEVTWLRLLQM